MDKNANTSSAGAATRRDFIRTTATAAAAVAATGILQRPAYAQAKATGKVIGANDRIAVAYVGIGGPPSNCPGMGLAHVKSQKKIAAEANIVQAAVCDLYSKRNDIAKEAVGTSDVQAYDDYRKILDRKDIDAVVIATHDPWHAKIAIDAMEAGKHVYCEKPMTRYLHEAFEVADAVKRTGKVFQVGSQGTSAAGWHKAAEMIKAGKIGKMVWAQGFYCRNNPKGEWNYSIDSGATPETVKWNEWLGPVKKKIAFNPDHFFRWRKFYPYCSGLLGDLVPHRLHPLMLATGSPEFPKRVVCVGSKHVGTDANTSGALSRDVAEHIELIAEFPSGLSIVVASSTVNAKSPGFVIYGHHATLNIGNMGEKLELVPEKDFADEIDPELLEGLKPTEDVAVHEKNWFDSIRSNKQPNGNIDLAVRVQTVITLAEMSDRLGITCLFDEKTRKVYVSDGKGRKEVQPITYDREIELAQA
jgi:predicted dehydrogenase